MVRNKEAIKGNETGLIQTPFAANRLTTITSATELRINHRLGCECQKRFRSRTR